jgi:hypothetical protein
MSSGVCGACGRSCVSAALVSCPTCGGAISAAADASLGQGDSRNGWRLPPMRHPQHYTWFVFLSALDVMLTWVVLLLDGHEVNPLARAVVDHGGLPSLVTFKFCLVVFVIVMCEWVTRRNPRAGFKLAEWSVAVTAIPVVIAFALLATTI